MEDSDEADEGGASLSSAVLVAGSGEPARPSDVEAADRNIAEIGPDGLSWVAPQIFRETAPAVGERLRFELSARISRRQPWTRIASCSFNYVVWEGVEP